MKSFGLMAGLACWLLFSGCAGGGQQSANIPWTGGKTRCAVSQERPRPLLAEGEYGAPTVQCDSREDLVDPDEKGWNSWLF